MYNPKKQSACTINSLFFESGLGRLILCFLLAFGCSAKAFAQAEGDTPATFWLSFSIWNDGFNLRDRIGLEGEKYSESFYLVSDGAISSVVAPYGRFGDAKEYAGQQVTIYDRRPVEGMAPPPVVAQFTLAEGMKDVGVILVPLDGDTYRPLLFDNSLDEFPKGSVRLQSFYPKPIYIRTGEETHTLEPYALQQVSVTDPTARGLRVQVAGRDEQTGKAFRLLQRFIRMGQNDRYYAFILPHPVKTGTAEMRLVPVPDIQKSDIAENFNE